MSVGLRPKNALKASVTAYSGDCVPSLEDIALVSPPACTNASIAFAVDSGEGIDIAFDESIRALALLTKSNNLGSSKDVAAKSE